MTLIFEKVGDLGIVFRFWRTESNTIKVSYSKSRISQQPEAECEITTEEWTKMSNILTS